MRISQKWHVPATYVCWLIVASLAGCGGSQDAGNAELTANSGSKDADSALRPAEEPPALPTASITSPAKSHESSVSAEQPEEPIGPPPEEGTAEWLLREINIARLQPFADSNEVDQQKQERNRKIIELAEQAIALSCRNSGKQRIFEVAVHHLTEAQLELAIQGNRRSIEDLYENAEALHQQFPQSRAAAEAAYAVVKFAHTNAQRFADREPRWLQELARQAQLFARTFPQEGARAVPLLLAAGQSCEFHGLTSEALDCYTAIHQGFPDNPRAEQVVALLRRLTLKGQQLQLAGPTIDGGSVSVDAYKGKAVLIVYWASQAKPFLDQLPTLMAIISKYDRSRLQVLGVNLDVEEPAVDAFLESHPIDWPQIFYADKNLRGWDHPLAIAFGIRHIPALWLVDANGIVVETQMDLPQLETHLRSLLGPTQKNADR